MSWAGLASNQMVSYTDAQGGGFTLQSGQSSVTSNQCMTKDDALTKYVLDSSYMTSYASNQLVPKSVWVAGGITYTQIFNLYNDPCGTTVTIYLGSDGKYYSNTSGSLYTGFVYEFIGYNGFNYKWSESEIISGVISTTSTVLSPCSPS